MDEIALDYATNLVAIGVGRGISIGILLGAILFFLLEILFILILDKIKKFK